MLYVFSERQKADAAKHRAQVLEGDGHPIVGEGAQYGAASEDELARLAHTWVAVRKTHSELRSARDCPRGVHNSESWK